MHLGVGFEDLIAGFGLDGVADQGDDVGEHALGAEGRAPGPSPAGRRPRQRFSVVQAPVALAQLDGQLLDRAERLESWLAAGES